ncbi:MAG: tRNA preQ1(34) S-adenosylmethionine ribosyltransferase-isomerase QueA [Paracoccaceae bacterium]
MPLKLSDFNFDLPEGLIAMRPKAPKGSAKLLHYEHGHITDCRVADLVNILRPNDLLVLNNTRVIAARLNGERRRVSAQGDVVARIEITLMNPTFNGQWRAMAKPLRKVLEGEIVHFTAELWARVISKTDLDLILEFNKRGSKLDAVIEGIGQMPLPPYIAGKRAPDEQDQQDYQSVFARHVGAVASPTASLHFDQALLYALASKGVTFCEVTLHVGAGTFLPVKVEDVATHKMHAEWGDISAEAAAQICATKEKGGRVIAVGTTALRLIETAAQSGPIRPWQGLTKIFIYPGFQFRITDGLMTNFHLPKSTLLMLVAALIGKGPLDAIYAHAIAQKYRFFSYGDSSLLFP